MRVATYDRAANERNAVSALYMSGHPLHWFRLDDGVMGGLSETHHTASSQDEASGGAGGGVLHFAGTINTSGGGFASVRTKIPADLLTPSTTGLRLRYRGDGKTYKVFLTDGNRSTGGPMSKTPSWQADLPTRNLADSADEWDETTVPLSELLPNFGGRMTSRPPEEERHKYVLDVTTVREVGLMLSLKLSDGRPNPKETFGEGVFPFSLQVQSIEPVMRADGEATS